MTYQEAFTKILEIINYQENKEEFISSFTLSCMKEAAGNLINALPEDKKLEFQKSIPTVDSTEKFTALLNQYVPEDQYQKAFQQVLQKNFVAYIETIRPTLTPDQQNQLAQYLIDLSKTE